MSAFDNPLINGLGGTADFGENVLGRNDDSSTGFIDVTSVFESGLNFFGTVYNGFYINNNGNITFNRPISTFTPFALTGNTGIPIIAPFFTDVDTRAGAVTPSLGGNSTGSNLVYWDLDTVSDTVTITWDDVGEYSGGTTPNAFQIRLYDTGGGNFTTEFRYEDIQWNHGNARAGYSAADGTNYFELPQSGTSTILDVETASNVEQPGVFLFAVRNGVPNRTPTDITLSASSVDENNSSGTVIGTLTTTDPDQFDAHTYSLVDDAGGRFAINGNQLVVADGALLDYETNPSHNAIIRTTDIGGFTYDESFTININDLNEPDLRITTATSPTTASLGETFQVNWTVTNQGDGEALENWVDSVYLSDDAIFDSSDRQLTSSLITVETSLAASGNYSQQVNVTIPDITTTGSKYLLFVTDKDNQQREVNESNNVLAQSIAVTAADLQVDSLTIPASATFGNSVNLSWTVRNAGDGTATKGWRDRIWLSKDATFSSDDILLLTKPADATVFLAPGSEYTQTTSVELPLAAELNNGNYFVLAQTDALSNQLESNEANNVIVSAPLPLTLPPLPDLVVSNIVAPVEGLSGQQIEIAWTVTNQGNGDATGTWTDRVYLSNDSAIGGDQLFGDFSFTGTITAGESIVRKQLITLPIDMSSDRWVVVQTEASNQLFEHADENNNTRVDASPIDVRLSPFPNLQLSSVTAPPTAFSGQQTVVEWTVTNTGTGATSSPAWSDSVWLSLDTTFDDTDTFLGSVDNASYLNVGDSYNNRLAVTLPRNIDNNYYFLVKTDSSNQVSEFTNEGDNFGTSAPTNVELTPPPDLQLTSVNAPAQAFSGQTMDLSWTVTNQGPGLTRQTTWSDAIYLSTDTVLDDKDVRLAQPFHIGELKSGESYNATQYLTLPVGVSGDFYFLVNTDFGDRVYEQAFESNNTSYDPTLTRINLTPPPDLEVELVNAPTEALASHSLTLNYRVTNFGATATPNFSWEDSVYLSTDNQLDLGTDLNLSKVTHLGSLDIGASYDGSASFTLPNGLNGNYYAFVVSDSGNTVFELDNNNNVSFDAVPITVSSRPADLVISTVDAPVNAEAGKASLISWTVTNQGTGDTARDTWTDRVFASTDAVFSSDDVLLGSFTHDGLLNPGQSYSQSQLVTIPFNLVGQYHLFIATDTDSRVYEATSEDNNSSSGSLVTITRQTPDLQTAEVTAPATALSGSNLTVSWTVQNLGAGRTNANYWYDNVYFSQDQVISNDDIYLGQVYHSGAIDPLSQYNSSGTFKLPVDLTGNFYTLVRTDATDQVLEGSLENNNVQATTSRTTIALSSVPDLTVQGVDAPIEGISGQSFNVSWTVRNDSSDTGNQTWYDAIYISRDQIFDRNTDTYLGFKNHTGGLTSGQSYTETQSFTNPQGFSGPFYVFAVADSGNQIYERSGELNNVGYDGNSMQVSLAAPADLLVGQIAIPANAIPGQNATISYTVDNQGTNAARGNWYDSLYISADDQWDIGDTFFGRVQHIGDVASGSSYSETLTAPLPGVVPGNYHIIIRSDIRDHIPESNQTNNIKASLEQVITDAEQLFINTPDTGILAQDQSVFYRVEVPAGETLVVDFDSNSSTASNEVYVSFGEVPTQADFDFAAIEPFSADQRVVIPSTGAGTYFIRVFGNNIPSEPAVYNISAELVDFSVFDGSYGRGGNAGNLTIEINGAKFDRTVTAHLTDDAGVERAAVKVYHLDTTKAFATFDLKSLAPGNYDVIVGNADGDSITVSDGLEVVAGGSGNNRPTINAPSSVRRNSSFNFTASWGNDGINDAVAPLLLIGNDTVPFGFNPGDFSAGRQITFLGTTDEGPAGILRPGQGESITFFSASGEQPGTYEVVVDRLFNDLDAPFDFDAIRSSLMPVGISDAEFQPIFNQFMAQIGSTQGDYLQMLSRNATLLPLELGDSRFEADLLELELTKATAAIGTSISGNVFARSFDVDLSGIEVRVENINTGELFTSVTLNDGSFIFEDLIPGSYSLAVPSAVIQEASLVTVDLEEGEAFTGLTIDLEAGASIFGNATSAARGNSVANAGVSLFSGNELVDTTLTNAEGQFSFGTLSPGTYTLIINSEELARTWTTDVVVADGDVRVDVPLTEESLVTGDVNLSDGQPTQDLLVIASLRSDEPFPIFSDVFDSGNFSLGSLAEGIYDITVFQQGYVPFELEDVNIAAGEAINLGTIELVANSSTAPLATSKADAFLLPAAVNWLPPGPITEPRIPASVFLLKAVAAKFVFDIIEKNNLGQEVADIAGNYFYSEGPNDLVYVSPDSFKNDQVTKDALEYILRAFAIGIPQKLDKPELGALKDAIENFDCSKGTIRISFDVQSLRQVLELPETLLNVDVNSPEFVKDIWKYNKVDNIPGFLAGGVGLGGPPPLDVPTIPDSRRVSGNITVNISSSGWATLEADFNVEIQDTFDFKPGGLGQDVQEPSESIKIAAGVIGLGLLEDYGLAYDVPFRTSFREQMQSPLYGLYIPPGKVDCCNDDCNDKDDLRKINIPTSFDPNDILGLQGFGAEHWVANIEHLNYTIRFENDPVFATAPAQTVRITQQLDSDLDFRTFRVGDFGFGDTFVDVPDNRAFYQTRLDLTSTQGIYVDVVAGIDIATGEAFWEFTSIDPATGAEPIDPLLGFLPPDLTSPEGEGFVSYTARPKSTIETGAVIDAQARIVFDINEPIDTPAIFNTIDAGKPISTVNALPALIEDTTSFLVSWSGSDNAGGSALADFTIYVSDNGGDFAPWLENTTLTEATFIGEAGHTYAFYSRARDNAGNIEAAPTSAQASTATESPGTLAFSAAQFYVNEDGTPVAQVTLNRAFGSYGVVSGTVTLMNGTAVAPSDYDNTSIEVSFADGEITKTVVIPLIDDLLVESDEIINLTLRNPTGGATIGAQSNATLTIADNDVQLAFSAAEFSVNENGTLISIVTVSRSGRSRGTVSAEVTLTDATANSPSDYDSTPVLVEFSDREMSKTVVIPIVDDTLVEASETINLLLNNPTGGATLGAQSTATLTIIDNDVQLAFSAASFSVNEDGTPIAAVTVTRAGRSTGVVSATITPTNGTALSATDYDNTPIDIRFADGEITKTVIIPIIDDTSVENDETINLTLSAPTGGATIGLQNTATLTIEDNDVAPIRLIGTRGNDTLIGGNGNDTLDGRDGFDSLSGGVGKDSLIGGTGNDTLDGGTGNDTLVGGTGNDTYVVDTLTDTIVENVDEGTDTIKAAIDFSLAAFTNVENLALTGNTAIRGTGNSLDNGLTGNDQNNILDGGSGDDTLNGNIRGDDTLIGGVGNDIYIINADADTIVENASEGTDTVRAAIDFSLAGLTNVEHLTLIGNAISGTGNSLDNNLTGNAENNILDGGSGDDTLNGGSGNDTLIGGVGNDVYIVDAADTIVENTGEGTDTVRAAIDFSLAAIANVQFLTLTGNTAIRGTGNSLNNNLTGNAENNILDGGSGDDILNGGSGNDTLIGGVGNDVYIVDAADTIVENTGEGTDTVKAAIDFSLVAIANVENLTLTGNAISATGNSLKNTLTGNTESNNLNGDAGNDILIGSTSLRVGEVDSLTGGAGADKFLLGTASNVLYNDGSTTTSGETSYALITDFSTAADQIQIKGTALNYSLVTAGTNTEIHFNNANQDLIGVVQNVTGLSLNASYFTYVV